MRCVMGFSFIENQGTKRVIDIQGASTLDPTKLDAFGKKSTDNDNQQWEFTPGPPGTPTGVFMIVCKDGRHVAATSSGEIVATKSLADAFLWRFVEDPAGSGYCFIQNATNPDNAIMVTGQQDGALLGVDLLTASHETLWKVDGGSFPSTVSLPTTLEFTCGTGSGTTGSGSGECAYYANLTIQRDGTCHFWGSYTNRGDTTFTAPPQVFAVVMVVHNLVGVPYCFSYAGWVSSAPQPGSAETWDNTQTSSAITSDWASIASRNQASCGQSNMEPSGDYTNDLVSQISTASAGAGGPSSVSAEILFGLVPQFLMAGYGNGPPGETVPSSPGPSGSLPGGWVPSGAGQER